MKKEKYYSLKRIEKQNADYNIIIGERSNGKTYSVLYHIIEDYLKNGREGAYIRRWKEDIIGKRGDMVFSALVQNNVITDLTNGEYDNIIYTKYSWHFAKYDNKTKKMIPAPTAFCYAFALSDNEHDKSVSYPNVYNIVFDEFLTRRYYLADEFILFMNTISTIIRDRNNIKIYMLGNTVNKYCPYFSEMGLTNISNMEQGKIDIYSFNENLTIAVEYCDSKKESKKSNKYFCFNNPRLNMITSGAWELAIYPHLSAGYKIKPNSIMFTFYIDFDCKIIAGDVIAQNNDYFIYFRPHTKELKENDLCYSLNYNVSPYRRKSFLTPKDRIDEKIKRFFSINKVFYQSNDIGELVHNYLLANIKK